MQDRVEENEVTMQNMKVFDGVRLKLVINPIKTRGEVRLIKVKSPIQKFSETKSTTQKPSRPLIPSASIPVAKLVFKTNHLLMD